MDEALKDRLRCMYETGLPASDTKYTPGGNYLVVGSESAQDSPLVLCSSASTQAQGAEAVEVLLPIPDSIARELPE